MDSVRFRIDITALYSNVHRVYNVRHNGVRMAHTCRVRNHNDKKRYREQPFKVPLRFMFHYCITH